MFASVCFGEMQKQRRNYFSSWSTYISLLLWPILTVSSTFFSYKSFDMKLLKKIGIFGFDDLFVFLLTGFLCYNCFWVMVQSAFFMQKERENGTLETIFLSPAPRLALVYGRAMGALLQSTWIMVMYLICVLSIKKSDFLLVLRTLPFTYFIVIISAILWGGFINSIFVVSRDVDFWFSVCDEPMKLFSGIELPVGVMPVAFKFCSLVFPLTYCLKIIRSMWAGNTLDVNTLLRYFIVNGAIIVITVIILHFAEKNNRKTGNIQLY